MGFSLRAVQVKHLGIAYNCLVILKRTIAKLPSNYTKLAEVGRLDAPKITGYETGQLFLHRIFGYRGVILFPWTARVYDRDLHNPNRQRPKVAEATAGATAASSTNNTGDSGHENDHATTESQAAQNATETRHDGDGENTVKEVRGRVQTFYQVLIDTRDCPYIRAQTEAVTFLGNQDSNRSLYAIPGLDYVAHEDVMPYTSTEKQPLQHELFSKFLIHVADRDPPYVARDTLKAWQDKNQPWLELSDVHKETTENIRVTVIPFYMGCRETPASSVYWWRYCIRLENMGNLSVQLRERHWRIFSLSGTLETVRGRGVVGQEPILSPRLPAFQYSSHVSLQAPSGHMWGTFRLEREDGYAFDCKIPPFSLESKSDDGNSPTNTNGPTGPITTGKPDSTE